MVAERLSAFATAVALLEREDDRLDGQSSWRHLWRPLGNDVDALLRVVETSELELRELSLEIFERERESARPPSHYLEPLGAFSSRLFRSLFRDLADPDDAGALGRSYAEMLCLLDAAADRRRDAAAGTFNLMLQARWGPQEAGARLLHRAEEFGRMSLAIAAPDARGIVVAALDRSLAPRVRSVVDSLVDERRELIRSPSA